MEERHGDMVCPSASCHGDRIPEKNQQEERLAGVTLSEVSSSLGANIFRVLVVKKFDGDSMGERRPAQDIPEEAEERGRGQGSAKGRTCRNERLLSRPRLFKVPSPNNAYSGLNKESFLLGSSI